MEPALGRRRARWLSPSGERGRDHNADRFRDEKLYDEKTHVARQPDPPETVCTIPVMTLAAMMTLGLVAPAISKQEVLQTKSNQFVN